MMTCEKCGQELQDRRPRHGNLEWQTLMSQEPRTIENQPRFCSRCRDDTRFTVLCARYGLSVEDYWRISEQQGGRCGICLSESPPGTRLRIDHDHQTGAVRGLLCNKCNTGLGLFGDRLEKLLAAVEYLRKSGTS